MNEIKKELYCNKDKILPDDRIKENIKRRMGYDTSEQSLSYAHGGTFGISRRKFAVIAAALALIICLSILLPLLLKRSENPGVLFPDNKFDYITDADSFYAYGAASVGSMLGAAAAAGNLNFPTADNYSLADENEKAVDGINGYMPLVEELLGEGKIGGKDIGGNGDYDYGMSISAPRIYGENAVYIMYYNKKFTEGESEGDEREEEYSITGTLLVGEEEYAVEGEYSVEEDGDESESELSFKAYTDSEKKSYVEVHSESENEGGEQEKEFIYTFYDNGKITESVAVEYEKEREQPELMLTVGGKDRFLFDLQVENGKKTICARGRADGKNISFRVYTDGSGYVYLFEDGSSLVKNGLSAVKSV